MAENITFRARMVGFRQAIAQMWATASAAAGMGAAIEKSGVATQRAGRHAFLYNQALFTMRRYLYNATLATTALAAGSAVLGLKFDASMEQSQVSFEHFLGSQQAATKELDYLFELAAKTPFQFRPLTETARQFLAFGFNIGTVNQTLAATADAIATLGLSQEHVQRVIYAFSQMQVKGRIMGEEMRQLFNAGIPAARFLQEQLGLSNEQMVRIADARIPAEVGIMAIVRGMEQEFKGGAERIANTVGGQVSTLKDYTELLLGTIMMAPFERIREEFPRLLDTLQVMTEAMRDRGFYAMVQALDEATGGSYRLTEAVRTLHSLLRSLWETGGLVIEVMTPFLKVALLLAYALSVVTSNTLDFINLGGEPLIFVLQGLVLWLTLAWMTEKLVVLWTARATAAATLQTAAIWLLRPAILAVTAAQWAWFLTLYFGLGPIGLLVLSIVALAAGLTVLYIKFERLRGPINFLLIYISPLAALILFLGRNLDFLLGKLDALTSKLGGLGDWVPDWMRLPGINLGGIPGLAAGGTVLQAGMVKVGETGPELLRLPRGAEVVPLQAGFAGAGGFVLEAEAPVQLVLDRRVIGEASAKWQMKKQARQ